MPNDTYPDGPPAYDDEIAEPAPDRPSEEARRRAPVTYTAPRERYRPPSYVRWIASVLVAFVALLLVCGGSAAAIMYIAFNSTTVTSTVDKAFNVNVSGVPTLMVHSAIGSVHVNPGAAGRIALHATLQAGGFTHAQAQSELNAIHVTTTQTGDVVNVQLDAQNTSAFDYRQIDLSITAPATTNVSVVEDAGSLDASGLTGKLTVRVNAGHVTLSDMTMAQGSLLRVDAGSLTVDGALQPGASLFIEVNAGSVDLTLPQNTSAHLDAIASAGSVNVNGWNVATHRVDTSKTASGDLTPNPTGVITIRVHAGSATINAA